MKKSDNLREDFFDSLL